MLHPFARALAWYAAGGFAVSLLCAVPYFDPDSRTRRPLLLAAIGPLHPVIALTALGIARDEERSPWPGLVALAASAALAVAVLTATAS